MCHVADIFIKDEQKSILSPQSSSAQTMTTTRMKLSNLQPMEMEAPGLHDNDNDDEDFYEHENEPMMNTMRSNGQSHNGNSSGSVWHSRATSPTSSSSSSSDWGNFLDQCLLLCRLHVESYPCLYSTILFAILIILFYGLVTFFSPAITRNVVKGDYSKISLEYNFKASQIDHWCLFVRV
jgi:hypothetical protein